LRSDLKEGNYAAFVKTYNQCLEKYPDAAVELFDAMFVEAGLPEEQGTFDQFIAKCSEHAIEEGEPGWASDNDDGPDPDTMPGGHDDLVQRKADGELDEEQLLGESHMSAVDLIYQDIGAGRLDIYDVMNNPENPEEEYVARELQDMYDDVANEYGLHPDDDFESIFDVMYDRIAHDHPSDDVDDNPEANDGDPEDFLDEMSDDDEEAPYGYCDVCDAPYNDESHKCSHQSVDESISRKQKKVGQLGPTEKVGPKAAVGKLVGTNESVSKEDDDYAAMMRIVNHKRYWVTNPIVLLNLSLKRDKYY